MSEALNTIHAYFGVQNTTTTAPVRQWAYGQKLIIHDNALPPVFEAYYSNSKSRGDAKPQIGQGGEVRAPREYFTSGADIYVFLMQHEGEEDGRYNKVVHIPITPAPKPVDIDPDPEESLVIGELVDALNDAVDYAEHIATNAGFMEIGINSNGQLEYTYNDKTDVDFALDSNGSLVMEVV